MDIFDGIPYPRINEEELADLSRKHGWKLTQEEAQSIVRKRGEEEDDRDSGAMVMVWGIIGSAFCLGTVLGWLVCKYEPLKVLESQDIFRAVGAICGLNVCWVLLRIYQKKHEK